MAYRFKKQIFGFMDLLRFKKMVAKRREKLETAPATPLPSTAPSSATVRPTMTARSARLMLTTSISVSMAFQTSARCR